MELIGNWRGKIIGSSKVADYIQVPVPAAKQMTALQICQVDLNN